jgi:octanoyl-[GcvH]:protein N-octanoyltransferase
MLRVHYFPEMLPAPAGIGREHQMADKVARGSPGGLVIWRAQPSLVITHNETRLPRFEAASTHLEKKGWPLSVRTSGGGAFPVAPGTVQLALLLPLRGDGETIDAIYDALAGRICDALAHLGISASQGNVPEAFCPGGHDIVVDGRKLAGLAQHWRQGTSGRSIIAAASILVEEDSTALSDVVNAFYQEAGSSFRCRPSAVTSLRQQAVRGPSPIPHLTEKLVDQIIAAAERGSEAT